MRYKDIEKEYPINRQERFMHCIASLLDQILEEMKNKNSIHYSFTPPPMEVLEAEPVTYATDASKPRRKKTTTE